MELIYWWAAVDVKQSVVMERIGIASEVIVEWFNYIRDIRPMWSNDHRVTLGGYDSVIEIDKAKFMYRKYYRGRWSTDYWVLVLLNEKH